MTGGVETIVVLGSWSSGTTAVTGYLHRLGADACPPHFQSNDPRTPNTYEPARLRAILLEAVNQDTLEARAEGRAFAAAFADWFEPERDWARRAGHGHIVLKHPLTAFFLPEIREICRPRFVVVTRAPARIEATRARRNWPAVFGAAGAQVIYRRIFTALLAEGIDALCLGLEGFLADAETRRRLAGWVGMAPAPDRLDAAETWLF